MHAEGSFQTTRTWDGARTCCTWAYATRPHLSISLSMPARSSMRGGPNLEIVQRVYTSRLAAAQAIAALVGRFLPRLGPLAFARRPFFFSSGCNPCPRFQSRSNNAVLPLHAAVPSIGFVGGRTQDGFQLQLKLPRCRGGKNFHDPDRDGFFDRSEPGYWRLKRAFRNIKRRVPRAAEQTSLLTVIAREQGDLYGRQSEAEATKIDGHR